MNPKDLLQIIIEPALSILPSAMSTTEAKAMLVAIALQESGIAHRKQMGGPARSLWQFEPIGIRGVQEHHATEHYANGLDVVLSYKRKDIFEAVEHNDILAAAYARLLLWQCPRALPAKGDADEGWRQYIAMWKPGRPNPDQWADNYAEAWRTV